MPNGETELTRTLTERGPLVRLNRVEMQLRLERHLAELRQDRMWQKSCHDALKAAVWHQEHDRQAEAETMIARVRIAPIERWCEEARDAFYAPTQNAIVAKEHINIWTDSMEQREHGRFWKVEQGDVAEVLKSAGRAPSGRPSYICEHMLELD